MTLAEFNNQTEMALKTITAVEAIVPNNMEIIKLLRALDDKDKSVDLEQIRNLLNSNTIAANKALSTLRDYSSLLYGIARETNMSWPPKCKTDK